MKNKIEEINKLLQDKPHLKCERVYLRDIDFIKAILKMPEWKDKKFQGLLTSNIWHSTAKDVETILSRPEWEDEKFQDLLTSNIWHSTAKDVQNILSIKKLHQEEYKHLLCPSIFNISYRNIMPSIELFEEYSIGKYITNRCLRRNVVLQRKLMEYMVENDINLLVEKSGTYILNPILSASNSDIKKKYGIDIKNLPSKGVKK